MADDFETRVEDLYARYFAQREHPWDRPPEVVAALPRAEAKLVERALRREVERLRKRWNDGEPFDAKGPVRRGRPPKP